MLLLSMMVNSCSGLAFLMTPQLWIAELTTIKILFVETLNKYACRQILKDIFAIVKITSCFALSFDPAQVPS